MKRLAYGVPLVMFIFALAPRAARAASLADNFRDYALLDIPSHAGVETFTNFPVLIRISASSIPGFDYARMASAADGADLRFSDGAGSWLPHEIDTWANGGESLVWVKIPSLPPAGIRIMMYWSAKVALLPNDPTQVWTAYEGVWHMNEIINAAQAPTTTSHDSTGKGGDGVPTKGASGNLAQMVSTAGKIGTARVNSSQASVTSGNFLKVGSYNLGDTFTFSGWYKMTAKASYPRVAGTKNGAHNSGWSVETSVSADNSFLIRGDGDTAGTLGGFAPLTADWVFLTFVYSGTTATGYSNGGSVGTVTGLTPVQDNGALSLGNTGTGAARSLYGSYDEVRIRDGVCSADRIAAEYSTMASNYFSFVATSRDGLLANRWIVEPSLTKTAWMWATRPRRSVSARRFSVRST